MISIFIGRACELREAIDNGSQVVSVLYISPLNGPWISEFPLELVGATLMPYFSMDNSPAGLLDTDWRSHWRHQIHALSSGFYPSSAYYAQFVRSPAEAVCSTIELPRFSASISSCLLLHGF